MSEMFVCGRCSERGPRPKLLTWSHVCSSTRPHPASPRCKLALTTSSMNYENPTHGCPTAEHCLPSSISLKLVNLACNTFSCCHIILLFCPFDFTCARKKLNNFSQKSRKLKDISFSNVKKIHWALCRVVS